MTASPRRPLLVAHRGDPRHAPENTLASFKSAIARGAQAVEMDARRCGDGTWVVFHDSTLGRTTNGRGRVSRSGWPSLAKLDAGGWFSPKFRGERIPRLGEALALCRSKRVDPYLDVKEKDGEEELARLLRRSGCLPQTTLLVGDLSSLQRWRELLPAHPLFWVTGYKTSVRPRHLEAAARLRLHGFASYKRRFSRKTLERLRRRGLQLLLWTVRTRREIERYARSGVDGMMSEVWPHHLPCPPKADGPSGRSRRARGQVRWVAG